MNTIFAILFSILTILVASTARAESILVTQSSNDIGLSLSSYQYQEPGIMSSKGAKLGLDVRTIRVLENGHFLRGDMRYAFGSVDYTGSGSANGQQDWYIDGRGVAGRDWSVGESVVAPYAGLGYRYLANDARGITSTGAAGYRRESNYFYLPVGITHRYALDEQARLVTEIEYDHLLAGRQLSKLSDAGLGYGDVTNKQSSGFGLRFSTTYAKENWAIGPYANYWNIGRSDTVPVYQNGALAGYGAEPKNNTVEFGLKASQQF